MISKDLERLKEYPTLTDPFMDFEATRQNFRTGSCNIAIRRTTLSDGRNLIYILQQREGEKVVSTPLGFKRVCEQGIVICGYEVKPRGLLSFLKSKRVQIVPQTERVKIEEHLQGELSTKNYLKYWE